MTKKELKELIKEVITEQYFTQESIGSKLKGMVSSKWQLSDEPYNDSWVGKNVKSLGVTKDIDARRVYRKIQGLFKDNKDKETINFGDYEPAAVYVAALWFGYAPEVTDDGIVLIKRYSPKTQAEKSLVDNFVRKSLQYQKRKEKLDSERGEIDKTAENLAKLKRVKELMNKLKDYMPRIPNSDRSKQLYLPIVVSGPAYYGIHKDRVDIDPKDVDKYKQNISDYLKDNQFRKEIESLLIDLGRLKPEDALGE